MADLKPKRGFVERDDWNAIGVAGLPRPKIWHAQIGNDLPVLLIPDPDRDPTPEEIEALARHLYETTSPTFDEKFEPYKSEPWGETLETVRECCRIYARAAWRLGARVPS